MSISRARIERAIGQLVEINDKAEKPNKAMDFIIECLTELGQYKLAEEMGLANYNRDALNRRGKE